MPATRPEPTTPALGSVHAQDRSEPVVLGQFGLSFYAVVGGVVQEVLESQG